MLKLKKYMTVIVITIFVSMLVGLVFLLQPIDRLSETQIAVLRSDYPIYELDNPPMMSAIIPTLDEYIEFTDCFVYGEVVGDMKTYSKYASSGIPELDEKGRANGITGIETYYEYSVRVLEDTEGIYQPGDILTIRNNIRFLDYRPKFENGMKIVFGAAGLEERPDITGCMTVGTYYVTDDGYALSAFPEEQKTMKSRGTYSGVKVEYLLKQLKKK